EGVAAEDLARLQASVEPALALVGAPMGEGVGNDVALGLPERVVTCRRRGAQRTLHVSRLDERRLALTAQILVLVVGPEASEAICLQLDLHLDVVRRRPAAGGALHLLRLGQNAEQILHVMPDLVRDHVGLRKLARLTAGAAAVETRRDLIE